MRIFRIALIPIGAIAVLAIGLSIYGKRGADSQYAKVSLGGYDESMTVIVTVLDSNGVPVSGASVESESFSGTSKSISTNSTGIAIIEPGETEVLALHVNGREVWKTPYKDSILNLLFSPSCTNGLSFTVDLKAEGRGVKQLLSSAG